jgi:hypothetical protein
VRVLHRGGIVQLRQPRARPARGARGARGARDGAGAKAVTDTKDRLRKLAWAYGRADAPLGSYLGLIALFNALLGGFLAARSQRLPTRVGLGDILLMGVATHKLSRLVAKDRVLSGLRAPVARYVRDGSPSEVEEQARGTGVQKAIGELVTCPYCVALWVAALLNYGLVAHAPATRLVASIFTTLAVSDFLQPLYARVTEQSEGGDSR